MTFTHVMDSYKVHKISIQWILTNITEVYGVSLGGWWGGYELQEGKIWVHDIIVAG